MSITLRISFIFLGLSALGFFFFAREEMGGTTKRYREATEEPLVDFAYLLAGVVGAESSSTEISTKALRTAFANIGEARPNAQIYNFLKNSVDLRVYITDAAGRVVFDSLGRDEGKDYSRWRDVRLTLEGSYGARSSHDDAFNTGSVIFVAAPIKVAGAMVGVLTVAKPNQNANQFIGAARKSTLLLGFVSFFTVAGLAVILSLIVTRPIHALTNYARSVRDGKRESLPKLTSGELKDLGDAFEEMREALEGRKYVEQYVQTLTHEIKSPLTAIRGAVEILKETPPDDVREKFTRNIEREVGRAQDLVNKLLSLSALQRRNSLDRAERISASALLQTAVEAHGPQAEARNQTLSVTSSAEALIIGGSFWIGEAIANVVQNALEFAPEGGEVVLSLSTEDGIAVMTVEDNGSGVPDWAMGKVFDQFYSLARPDTGKRSSGLGLTIVREVAELHKGSVTLENKENGGARVTLRFPLA